MRAVYVCPASGVPPEPCPCGEDLDGSARDVPGADQGVDVTTKDWPFEDRPDADAVADAGSDASSLDASDAQFGDAGSDAVAVADAGAEASVDAGTDVPAVDAAADRPDVVAVDAPRDAGPVDGGPVTYDLEAARAALEVRAMMHGTYPSGSMRDCSDVASSSCSVAGGVLNFSVNACFGVTFTGRFVLGDAGPSGLSIFGGGGGSSATALRFATGSRVVGRRSFHVQFSAPTFQGEPGFSGISGRTVDPALADLWLLGCQSE